MTADNPILQLSEQFETIKTDNVALREELDLVRQQFLALRAEDDGWISLLGGNQYEEDTGITLSTLQEVSKVLREAIAGSAFPRRANDLRYSYTFGKSFLIPEIEQDLQAPKKPGQKKTEQKFFDADLNQRYVFGDEAQVLINSATSTEGIYLLLGDNQTKTARSIPISSITDVYVNPEFNDEVWAYQRTWTPDPSKPKEDIKKWYLTDRYPEDLPKPRTIGTAPGAVEVDQTKTIIDLAVNRQTGWTLGIPDLMAAQIWNRRYLTMIAYGEAVSEVLATFAAKVKNQSKKGSTAAGVKLSGAGGGPKAFSYGEGNEIDVFRTLGSVYDFEKLRPIAAMYASAAGVSVVDLMAYPGAAGASYGSAQALQPGERRSIEARRGQIAAWYERVFKWGTGKAVRVTPAPLEEADPYRKMQMVGMAWQTGTVHPQELRPEVLRLAGITPLEKSAPKNILLPNNSDSWERADIDPKDGPATQGTSPDQGKSNGGGGTPSDVKNDLRSDGIGEALKRMQDDEFLDNLKTLVERMESAASVIRT